MNEKDWLVSLFRSVPASTEAFLILGFIFLILGFSMTLHGLQGFIAHVRWWVKQ